MFVFSIVYGISLFLIKKTKGSRKLYESMKKVLVLEFAEIFKKV